MGGSATLLTAAGTMGAAAKRIPIGVQLYSIRKACPKDVAGSFAKLAEMGYQGVEYAGYYGKSAAELRKTMDDAGLKCCGTHTRVNTLQGDALKKTVEFNQVLGNKYLIVPGLPRNMTKDVETVKKTADWFTETAAKVKDQGMRVGYHAHGGDFKKMDGDLTEWDILFTQAGPDVVMQLDTGNCIGGGGNPYEVLKKFPGRTLTIHLKPHGGIAIGRDKTDWKKVFELCETVGGTEWYIVEQESAPDKFDNVRACIEGMKKMGK